MSESNYKVINAYGTSIFTLLNVDGGDYSVAPGMVHSICTLSTWNGIKWVDALALYVSPDVVKHMRWHKPSEYYHNGLAVKVCEADWHRYILKEHTVIFHEWTPVENGGNDDVVLCNLDYTTDTFDLTTPDIQEKYQDVLDAYLQKFDSKEQKEDQADAE